MWPLETHLRSSSKAGFELNGYFDATDFIESPDTLGNRDTIAVIISSFETDTPSSSAVEVPYFQLMPCEVIRISLALEHYTLFDRPTSRCRDDYPEQLKSMLNASMTTDLFYNPAFAPHLPYDQYTCISMCTVSYWLPKCGCYGSPDIWRYAGMPVDKKPCPRFGENCTELRDAPWTFIQQCECHQKCSRHRFRIVSDEKIRYSYGNKTTFICLTHLL